MLWVKAFHIIFMVCWFAGLFYLPRLFVYHAISSDAISNERFKIMERKLYYGITTPSGLLTIVFGIWLMSYNMQSYLAMGWMHAKLALVIILVAYHFMCGHYLKAFKHDNNKRSTKFYRYFNEVTALILVAVIILVTVRPF